MIVDFHGPVAPAEANVGRIIVMLSSTRPHRWFRAALLPFVVIAGCASDPAATDDAPLAGSTPPAAERSAAETPTNPTPAPTRASTPAPTPAPTEAATPAADAVEAERDARTPTEPTPPTAKTVIGASGLIEVAPGVRAVPASDGRLGRVEFDAVACLDAGWLEQVVCTVGTREHEALAVVEVAPSAVHAALLLAGFESGTPGRWTQPADGPLRLDAPSGDLVEISFVWTDSEGNRRTAAASDWIVGNDGQRLERPRWRFGGSRLVDLRQYGGGPESAATYEADLSGSLIGLVTFGDETIGFVDVIPNASDVYPEEWLVDTDAVPPVLTPLVVRLDPASPDSGEG